MASATISNTLIGQLKAAVENPELYSSHEEEIVSLAYRAAVELRSPFDFFQDIAHAALPIVAIYVCQQHRILYILEENATNGNPATNTAALAHQTGLSPPTLETLLEYIVAKPFVERMSDDYIMDQLVKSRTHIPP
ncbi:hypothetical protein BDV23DRAFT_187277 [Aspergillus alliaceus]|uniref:Uncharacterized protein n=1 Tax=Petromyces alliaceus TaxID=209559 RepID=A0A5N7BY92_PETAA|nr:hypothetical protein BDV23DRAFT_187277 [Aspergillus alliaceus]